MNQSSSLTPRPLDHLVLPVAGLATARARYESLGFTVAPDGVHPFGTENCCVYLPDGTFVEPLAVHQRETCEAQAQAGNVFVARDQAFRFRRGEDGFSALVMATGNADGDHEAFQANGHSAGAMLSFSRAVRTPAGEEDEASFKLAFAADLRAPDVFFFTCQRLNAPKIDRTALLRHENGVTAIREVVAVEQNPSDFQYLLQDVASQREVEAHSFGMELALPNATLSVLTPDGFSAFFGRDAMREERGLRFEAVVFTVDDLPTLRTMLDGRGIAHRAMPGGMVIVDPAPGQGAVFAFQEKADL